MKTQDVSKLSVEDIFSWPVVYQQSPYIDEGSGIPIPGLLKEVREASGGVLSAGVFYWKDNVTFTAWGRKQDEVCGQHRLILPGGEWSAVIPGCPEFKVVRGARGEVVGFSLDFLNDSIIWSGNVPLRVSRVSQDKGFKKTLYTFLPLVAAFFVVGFFALVAMTFNQVSTLGEFMRYFMAGFFLLFGGLKVFNLRRFVAMYALYDLLAVRIRVYGYAYPFIELVLGFSYLFNFYPYATNTLTFGLMLVGAAGIFKALREGKKLQCACLGSFFSLPLTTVTLVEDLLMAGMAVVMLFGGHFLH